MAAVAVTEARPSAAPAWARKYPPLVALLMAVLIAVAVLPSALNLPQSNPSQTLEYAPVPPDDETPPETPPGNVNQFGLGSSQSLESDPLPEEDEALVDELDPPLPPDDDGIGTEGKNPSTKRCVGQPPRQTEDPLSPPCVANFEGDNFGSTYTGVTRDEIRILVYWQGNITDTNTCREPEQGRPSGEYFDMNDPPKEDEHCIVRVVRTWQKYFNDRYQTYGRQAHFYLYFSKGNTEESREADAADNFAQVKPFAVLSTAEAFADTYLKAMARRKVLNFGSFIGRENSFFTANAKLIWGYLPTLEIQADQYVDYLCKKVAPYPTSFAGTSQPAIPNGKKRVYGLWSTNNNAYPGLINLAKRVKEGVKACGIEFATEQKFPTVGLVQDNSTSPRYAVDAVAAFKNAGVTTIVWPSGLETNLSKQAATQNYRPEVVVLGDRQIEVEYAASFQEQTFWGQVRVLTNVVIEGRLEDEACFQAYKEADPQADRPEADGHGCFISNDLRQLFTGIQVAGPRLGPTNIDKGFHAIPKKPGTGPRAPACFYETNDYTCVKDSMAERWDSTANNNQGCYRAAQAGRRYLTGQWPASDIKTDERPDDPCNLFDDAVSFNLAPPDPTG